MPPLAEIVATYAFDPVAAGFLLAAAGLYGAGVVVAHRRGRKWPIVRIGFTLLGLAVYAWASFGFLGVESVQLRWAFVARVALLLLVVPWLIGMGKPVALAEAVLPDRAVERMHAFFESRVMRFVGNAVFEPVFTLALFLLFATPVAGLARQAPIAQAGVSVLIPLVGLLMVGPIVEDTRKHRAVFIAAEFMLAFAALVFDAVPAIVLRLSTVVLDRVPLAAGVLPGWYPSPLRDQQLAGDFLWFLAEVADIPVIVILFMRWARIDKKESQAIDELSDEEMAALTAAHLRRGH